jgi:hypothetical protein
MNKLNAILLKLNLIHATSSSSPIVVLLLDVRNILSNLRVKKSESYSNSSFFIVNLINFRIYRDSYYPVQKYRFIY